MDVEKTKACKSVFKDPGTGEQVVEKHGKFVREKTNTHIEERNGILVFCALPQSSHSTQQQAHYDKIATAYVNNLNYPHTQEYTGYLDEAFLSETENQDMGVCAEICCGRGEALTLLQSRVRDGIGIDLSINMLLEARKQLPEARFRFAQGDATDLPLECDSVDSVVMLGGIHHVPDRVKLFSEICRVLKPGGRFYWREPVSDFWLWRGIRAIIYRVSPMLEHESERPLLYKETIPVLEEAGLRLISWKTYGFLGFCLFMNSDVLYFNRMFRFIPGIRKITRFFIKLDQLTLRLPGLKNAGLQVVGVATKAKQS